MLQILIHSSKTMRSADAVAAPSHSFVYEPQLIDRAVELARFMQTLPAHEIARIMKLSDKKASEVVALWANWTHNPMHTRPAIDMFVGDIYSGMQPATLSAQDREYAQRHLLILSGLYGAVRALDAISPYRLEMGYSLPDARYANLYQYWGDAIAQLLSPAASTIVNLSAVEYTKAVLPHVQIGVVTPRFLTVHPHTGELRFVAVHAKIARGACARWLVSRRYDDAARLVDFAEIGYTYRAELSTETEPVFVCQEFGGLGMSIRRT